MKMLSSTRYKDMVYW